MTYAKSAGTAILPGDGIGLAIMSFEVSGVIVKDGTGVSRSFTFSSGTDSEPFAIDASGCH